MSDRDDPRLATYLQDENDYARQRTSHLDPLVQQIVSEITDRTCETDLNVPVSHGGWWYYTRTIKGLDYPIHARVPQAGDTGRPVLTDEQPPADERVLLDENAEAGSSDFFELGGLQVSPDGTRLAFAADRTGNERFDVTVRDLDDDSILDTGVCGITEGLAWSRDGRHLFYCRPDEAMRPFQVWRHEVGADPSQDTLVLEEPDERFFLSVGNSRDDRWIIVSAHSKTTSEISLLPADDATQRPRPVAARRPGVLYDIEPCGTGILLWHNATRDNFEIVWVPRPGAPMADWSSTGWTGPDELVTGVEAYDRFVAIALRADGSTAVRVTPVTDPSRPVRGPADFGMPGPVRLPRPAGTIGLGATPDPASATLQLVHESLSSPPSVWDLEVATGTVTLIKQRPVPGYDLGRLRESRLVATAADGAHVPISFVHLEHVRPDGSAPALLYGYGAYGVALDPAFSVSVLSLLDRGVVFALAHVRGGTELGWSWYEHGRLEHKEQSFTDFLACADELARSGWAAPDRVAAQGGSAGGLLVGAAVNLAPDRFRVVCAQVPFVDVLTTMLDPSLPLTATEREEWGDPLAGAAAFHRIRAYSPYENIRRGDYPAMVVTASLHDVRVLVTEPAKWVSRLRDRVTDDPIRRPIILRTELAAGHGGRSGRYQAWAEVAWEWAVLLDLLGSGVVFPSQEVMP